MSMRVASVLVFLLAIIICASFSDGATTSKRPSSIVLKVARDSKTLHYTTEIEEGTPLKKKRVVVDLSGDRVWVQCGGGSQYNSSTFRPARCNSAVCSSIKVHGCNNNTCGVAVWNPFILTGTAGVLGQDALALSSSTHRKNLFKVPLFTFACAEEASVLEGLPRGVTGLAALGRTREGLPSQLSAAFSFSRTFAVCLPSSTAPGALFFGKLPYAFLPGNKDVSQRLTFTPLLKKPNLTPERYFIPVTAIRVGEKIVAINFTKLKIDSRNIGGTELTTAVTYTTVARSMYRVIRDAFVKEAEAMSISRVTAVPPFDACFDASTVKSTRVGPGVPVIDLVLHNSKTMWKIMGANSMVRVSEGVLCLGFVDGGKDEDSISTIMIGGHQMQDNLLHFDLATSRLGFSNTLLGDQTTCSNFNFTSIS